MRDRLIELLRTVDDMRLMRKGFSECADHLLANGVIVLPCDVGTEIKGEIVHEIDYFKSLMASGEIHITKKVYTCDKEDVRKIILCSHPISWEEAVRALKGAEGK